MLSTCGDYVEHMLIFAQCSINILSNHKKGTSTKSSRLRNNPRRHIKLGDRYGGIIITPTKIYLCGIHKI